MWKSGLLFESTTAYVCGILVGGFSPALLTGQVASWLCLLRQK